MQYHFEVARKGNFISFDRTFGQVLVLVVALARLPVVLALENANDILRKADFLFRETNYLNPKVLKFGIALNQIFDLNEREQTLTTGVWMREYWTEPDLAWNPDDHNGTLEATIAHHYHWRPDLILYNRADPAYGAFLEDAVLKIKHNGDVIFLFPALYRTSCLLEIQQFPFDIQTCVLKFGSWAYDGTQLDIRLKDDNPADLNNYITNREWELISFEVERRINIYGCCPDVPFPDVIFSIKLKRYYNTYVMYLIVPNLLIQFLTFMQFILPCDSGEKISLGITIYLSMIVYLLLLQDILPPADVIPDIVYNIVYTLVVVAVSEVLTICVLVIHHKGKHDNGAVLPPWARHFVLHCLARAVCMNQYITPDDQHEIKLQPYSSSVILITEEDEEHESLNEKARNEVAVDLGNEETVNNETTPKSSSQIVLKTSIHNTENIHEERSLRDEYVVKSQSVHSQITLNETLSNKNVTETPIKDICSAENVLFTNSDHNCVSKSNSVADRSTSAGCSISGTSVSTKNTGETNKNNSRNSDKTNVNNNANKARFKAPTNTVEVELRNKTNNATESSSWQNRRQSNGSHPQNKSRRHSVSQSFGMMSCPSRRDSLVIRKSELVSNRDQLLYKILKHLEDNDKLRTEEQAEAEQRNEWQQVAMVLDRILFLVTVIAMCVLWIGYALKVAKSR